MVIVPHEITGHANLLRLVSGRLEAFCPLAGKIQRAIEGECLLDTEAAPSGA